MHQNETETIRILQFLHKDRDGDLDVHKKVNEFHYVLVMQNFKQYRNNWIGGMSAPPNLDRVNEKIKVAFPLE